MRRAWLGCLAVVMLWGVAVGDDAPPGEWPPAPSFETQYNYVAWFEQHRGEPGRAWAALAEAMPKDDEWPTLAGMSGAQPAVGIGPWSPADHEDWEQSFQASRRLVAAYKKAAGLPVGPAPIKFGKPAAEWPAPLMGVTVPDLRRIRALARASLDNAWRSRRGKPNARFLVEAIEANLRWAEQLEAGNTLIENIVASGLRTAVFEHVAAGVEHEVLKSADRERVMALLRSSAPLHAGPLRRALRGEMATDCDALQALYEPGPGGKPQLRAEGVAAELNGKLSDPAQGDANKSLQAVTKLVRELDGVCEKGVTMEGVRRYSALAGRTLRDAPVAERIVEPLKRWVLLSLDAEAMRRGAMLALALGDARESAGAWPDALAGLGDAVGKEARIDPYSGKPFVYKLREGRPVLYSVGRDGADDGGRAAAPKQERVDLVVLSGREAASGGSQTPAGAEEVSSQEPAAAKAVSIGEITKAMIGRRVTLSATVKGVVDKPSKTRKRIYIVTLEQEGKTIELIYWQDLADQLKAGQAPKAGDKVRATGKVSEFRGKLQLSLERAGDMTIERG